MASESTIRASLVHLLEARMFSIKMFSIKNLVYLGMIVATLAVFVPRSAAQTFSCSSDDGKRHYCSANARGRVRLAQQRSESPCPGGYSWGSGSRRGWGEYRLRA